MSRVYPSGRFHTRSGPQMADLTEVIMTTCTRAAGFHTRSGPQMADPTEVIMSAYPRAGFNATGRTVPERQVSHAIRSANGGPYGIHHERVYPSGRFHTRSGPQMADPTEVIMTTLTLGGLSSVIVPA